MPKLLSKKKNYKYLKQINYKKNIYIFTKSIIHALDLHAELNPYFVAVNNQMHIK